MVDLNLRLDQTVIVDAVDDSEEARQTWRGAATRNESRIEFVHLVISDALEHERRFASRDRGLDHVGEPTWADVRRRRAGYAAWSDAVVEVDTAVRTADAIISRLDSAGGGVDDGPKYRNSVEFRFNV